MVDMFYKGVKSSDLWQKILTYKEKQFPNICLLAEIVLTLGPSNSVVEKGFSQLTAMLSDRRLSMKPITMGNLLIIKVNHLTWPPEERDEIIERALEIYMQKKRRKLKLDVTPFNMIGVVQGKKKRISSSESENESSSSGSDVVEVVRG